MPATPLTWFDLWRPAGSPSPTGSEHDADGLASTDASLDAIPLEELRAVLRTLWAWRWAHDIHAPGGEVRAAMLDRAIAETEAMARRRAEAVLGGPDTAPEKCLAFPPADDLRLADSQATLAFLQEFLPLRNGRSLTAWTRALATDEAIERWAARPWFRLLLQKAAAESDLPEALNALRHIYGEPERRLELRREDADALAAADQRWCAWWAQALDLDCPPRILAAVPRASPRSPAGDHGADVTVIIPSYNHGPFIEDAISSVLAQSSPRLRVLVVDDRSTDDTVTRARAVVDPRVEVFVNTANLGLADSVLAAVDRVQTPFTALLNSDDVFHPDRLAACLRAFAAFSVAQVVATRIAPMDGAGRRLTPETTSRLFDGRRIADWVRWFDERCRVPEGADVLNELLERNFLVTSSNIVARTEFLRGHAARFRGLKYCLDWQVFLDAALAGGLVVLQDELVGYRLHASNTVWFDEARAVAYRLEVNRVLVAALTTVAARATVRDGTLADGLDALVRHAARHSDADGVVMAAVSLWGGERLEAVRAVSTAVHDSLREAQALDTRPAEGDGATPHAERTVAAELLSELARRAEQTSEQSASELRAEVEREQAALHGLRRDLAALREALDVAGRDAAHHAAALNDERARATREAQAAATAQAAAIVQLKSSPEYLLGDRLWNRAHLSRVGAPTVRAMHAWQDRRNRWGLALRGLARQAGVARPGAIVTACWSFPIHSQTFVYQEMTALAWTGLDTRVFCCDTNPKSELPAAFAGLWPKRLVMQTDWAAGQRDLAHFRRTRPARVEALLALLAQATGRTPDVLLQESIVLSGFTFARHVELARAAYLHTYFFYDQSFLALMAAYLLEIPRGITCYADHMLGDYAFKLVPLHLQLADVVVATSARIKEELVALGGEPGKIVVKPNGIDVARFLHVPAATRLALAGVPELVAVQRIEPKKGLIHLVDAMARLRDRGVAARLNVVGGVDVNTPTSAACHRELLGRIDALGLADAVVLHGSRQQHEFAPIAARSRLFVAPYVETGSGDKDGIPTAVLEAMSTGLPIVATDAGSIAEASRDGVEAFIVPQRDPDALADVIARLLTDPALYTRMSDAARARAVNAFDIHVTETVLHERIRERLATSTPSGAASRWRTPSQRP